MFMLSRPLFTNSLMSNSWSSFLLSDAQETGSGWNCHFPTPGTAYTWDSHTPHHKQQHNHGSILGAHTHMHAFHKAIPLYNRPCSNDVMPGRACHPVATCLPFPSSQWLASTAQQNRRHPAHKDSSATCDFLPVSEFHSKQEKPHHTVITASRLSSCFRSTLLCCLTIQEDLRTKGFLFFFPFLTFFFFFSGFTQLFTRQKNVRCHFYHDQNANHGLLPELYGSSALASHGMHKLAQDGQHSNVDDVTRKSSLWMQRSLWSLATWMLLSGWKY